jgi:hypothetical protein
MVESSCDTCGRSGSCSAANVYATALQLSGISPTGKGLNTAPPMPFIKKP